MKKKLIKEEVLATLDLEFNKEALDWLIGLFDGESGGMYYSESARDNAQFEPDIESVCQHQSILQTLGLVEQAENGDWLFPEWYRVCSSEFIKARQDPDDGYFYDPVYRKIAGKEKLERNTGFANAFLREMREKPLYATPMERMKAAKAEKKSTAENGKNANAGLEIYESPESFIAWLDDLKSKTSSYVYGSYIASGDSMIRASGLSGVLVDWLVKNQNPENGTWEKNFDMAAVNGVLKLCGQFSENGTPYPNLEVLLDNLIDFTKTFTPRTAAENWNPLGSLRCIVEAHPNLPPRIREKLDQSILEMISNTVEKMRMFRQPDGGFGYLTKGSSVYSNSVVVSLGSPEGDVNAMALMMLVYNEAYRLTGTPRSHPWKKYREYFWDEMYKRRAPYIK